MTTKADPPNEELEDVFTSIDPTRMQIARDFLTQAGIECYVFDSEASRMLGTTAAIPSRLMVHADAAEEARKRLKELGFED
jgi:Putative prokaryotic signal transducing protein